MTWVHVVVGVVAFIIGAGLIGGTLGALFLLTRGGSAPQQVVREVIREVERPAPAQVPAYHPSPYIVGSGLSSIYRDPFRVGIATGPGPTVMSPSGTWREQK